MHLSHQPRSDTQDRKPFSPPQVSYYIPQPAFDIALAKQQNNHHRVVLPASYLSRSYWLVAHKQTYLLSGNHLAHDLQKAYRKALASLAGI